MVDAGNKLSPAARRFLRSGHVTSRDPKDIVNECDSFIRALAQKRLAKALTLARQLVEHTRHLPTVPRATALRTLGWVSQVSAMYKEAEAAYLAARELSRTDADTCARIDRILIDVYMYLGDNKLALRRARMAMHAFRKLHDRDGEIKTTVNLANVYHRQDRHVDALRLYRQATTYYEKTDQKLTLGVCCYNCANCLVQLLQFDEADDFYQRAETLFGEVGYDLYVNEARYGRAWLEKLRGNYHHSLQALAACEDHYRSVGQAKGVTLCQLDRAEVMLELQLLSDARELAMIAERGARRLHIHYEAAKAALFLAKANYGLGSRREAKQALKRATEGFKKAGNIGMQSVAHFYDALYRKGPSAQRELASARRLFNRAQVPLWEAVCDLTAVAVSAPSYDEQMLSRLRRNAAVRTVPHLYAGWRTLLGDRALYRERVPEAIRNWKLAADTLDQVRAKLPPIDLHLSLSEKDLDPYDRLVKAEISPSPESAAIWSERSKVAGMWAQIQQVNLPDARASIHDRLARLAQHVTALSSTFERTRGESSRQVWQSYPKFRRLQRDVRRQLLATAHMPAVTTALHENFRQALHACSAVNPLVQFHETVGRLIAFVHHQGVTRSHTYELGNQSLTRFLGQWNILLGEMLARGKRVRRVDIGQEERLLRQLSDWLWAPLELNGNAESISVIPSGKMASIPWYALFANGQQLAELTSLRLAPSVTHLLASEAAVQSDGGATIFVGDTAGLSCADREIELVSQGMNVETTIKSPCRRSDWPQTGDALLWHYIGHAQFRGDNPFYSSLSLADGPVFAADFRLRRCRVWLVTLSACRTGVQSSLPTYESTGLVRSLLEMGAQNVIGSHWSVSDQATSQWMQAFYANLGEGLPLLKSVQKATLSLREQYASAGFWGAFSLFGAGSHNELVNGAIRDKRRINK